MIAVLIAFVDNPQTPAQEGTDVITMMLAVGLVFLLTIGIGELVSWAGHRKQNRH